MRAVSWGGRVVGLVVAVGLAWAVGAVARAKEPDAAARLAWIARRPPAGEIDWPLVDLPFVTGFRVGLSPTDAAPVVGLVLRVDAGSAHEPEGAEGIAHLVEHLAFRGRVNRTWDASERLASLGCVFNATTTFDHVTYDLACPASSLAGALQFLAHVLTSPLEGVDDGIFEQERAVVVNEVAEDADARQLVAALLAKLHRDHPYDHLPGGRPERLTLEQARGFVADRYLPGNATLVVTGAFDVESTMRLLFRVFPPRVFHPDLTTSEAVRWVLQGGTIVVPRDPADPNAPLPFGAPVDRRPGPGLASSVRPVVAGKVEAPTVTLRSTRAETVAGIAWLLDPFDATKWGVSPEVVAACATAELRGAPGACEVTCSVLALRQSTLLVCACAGDRLRSAAAIDTIGALFHPITGIEAKDRDPEYVHPPSLVARRFWLDALAPVASIADDGGRLRQIVGDLHEGRDGRWLARSAKLAVSGAFRKGFLAASTYLAGHTGRVQGVRFVVQGRNQRAEPSAEPMSVQVQRVSGPPPTERAPAMLDAERLAEGTTVTGLRVVALHQGDVPGLSLGVWIADPSPSWTGLEAAALDAGPFGWWTTVRRAGARGAVLDIADGRMAQHALVALASLFGQIGAGELRTRAFGPGDLGLREAEAPLERWAVAQAPRLAAWFGLAPSATAPAKRWRAKDLAAFLAETYAPERVTLVIVAPTPASETLALALQAFGGAGAPRATAPWPAPPVAAPAPRVSAVVRRVVPDTGRIDLALWAACDVPLSAVDLDVLEDSTQRWLFARLREDRGAVYTPYVSVSRGLVTPTVLLGANVAPGKVPDVLRAWGDLLRGAGPSASDVQTSASRYPLRESVFGRQSAWLAQVHLGAALTHGASVEGWRTITPLLDGFSATKVAGVLGRCPEVIVGVTGRADPLVDREVRAALPGAVWFEEAPADEP